MALPTVTTPLTNASVACTGTPATVRNGTPVPNTPTSAPPIMPKMNVWRSMVPPTSTTLKNRSTSALRVADELLECAPSTANERPGRADAALAEGFLD